MDVAPTSLLFITLDSCRFDTFASVSPEHLSSIGTLHKAMAPGNFTLPSHAAMFSGFTPGVPSVTTPWVNPKYARPFRLASSPPRPRPGEFATLNGHNIVAGFAAAGYATIGSGAVGWFNPAYSAGRVLTQDFERYFFPGDAHSLDAQLRFVFQELRQLRDRPVFVFLNVGETHAPYWHHGAAWSVEDDPCVPFSSNNDAVACRDRQRACLDYVDGRLGELLDAFSQANVLVCGDHGDAWGEDGVWHHGTHHEKVLEVPLLLQLRNPPSPAG